MARSSRAMADELMRIYNGRKRRFRLSSDAFKKLAGKTRLKSAYLNEVDSFLREDGYLLIDLRQEHNVIAVVRQTTVPLRYDDLSDEVEEYYDEADEVDDDEE